MGACFRALYLPRDSHLARAGEVYACEQPALVERQCANEGHYRRKMKNELPI
jgi:hypothetical protein